MCNLAFLKHGKRTVERAKQLTGVIGVFILRYAWVCFFKIITHFVFNCAVKTIRLRNCMENVLIILSDSLPAQTHSDSHIKAYFSGIVLLKAPL